MLLGRERPDSHFYFWSWNENKKIADEVVCVGEQHKMLPEQRTAFHFHFPDPTILQATLIQRSDITSSVFLELTLTLMVLKEFLCKAPVQ